MERDINIDYDELVSIVRNQFVEVMEDNYDFYKDYQVKIGLEQQFIKQPNIDPKAIYMVMKFGATAINYCQSVVTCNISCISEQNKLNVCQKLLLEYSKKFNLAKLNNGTIQQMYDTPNVQENFENVYEGYRSLLTMECVFVLTTSANFYTLYNYTFKFYSDVACTKEISVGINNDNLFYEFYINNKDVMKTYLEGGYCLKYTKEVSQFYVVKVGDESHYYKIYNLDDFSFDKNCYILLSKEEVDTLSTNFDMSINLDSQPFFNSMNFSKSIAKTGTITIGFSSYLLSDVELMNKALHIALKRKTDKINDTFLLQLVFNNGDEMFDVFKLMSFNSQQQLGDIPTASMSFTN